MKDYSLTCGEVVDNLLMLADAYEKASAGKSPNGFAFNPADAAANMKAAVHFIGSFGKQVPRWIPVEERLPENDDLCLVFSGEYGTTAVASWYSGPQKFIHDDMDNSWAPTHWMSLPDDPEEES